ncbi:MAG: transaldolase family protein [Planctomycetaceae bacterium]
MTTPLDTLIASGTKLWLDSVDPDEISLAREYGTTGATSNPLIIAGLIQSGRFDTQLNELLSKGLDDETIAWTLTDRLVRDAQNVFQDVYESTAGDDGYVSFELDPLLEDADCPLSIEERKSRYIELGRQWSADHVNRMIKVPATPAGLASLEELAASGVTLNVTLIFSKRQYEAARDAIWKGAQRRDSLDGFKSVYSIFVSRVDVYTKKHLPQLSDEAQGLVGIVNAKRIWRVNTEFWKEKNVPLKQEMIFASTGTKDPNDPPDKYVKALAGSDIQTNPPALNRMINESSGTVYSRTVDQLPSSSILDEIDREVDVQKMEDVLMSEGLEKFADPQKSLIALIAEKRQQAVS